MIYWYLKFATRAELQKVHSEQKWRDHDVLPLVVGIRYEVPSIVPAPLKQTSSEWKICIPVAETK